MPLTREQLQDLIATGEFDRWMDLKVEVLCDASLTMRLPFRREIIGTPKANRLHGGVISSLIDAASCYLLIALCETRVSTVNLVVDFLRPAYGEVVAHAKVVKLGNKICNLTVDVTNADGKLAATGRVTVLPVDVPLGDEERMIRSSASAGTQLHSEGLSR